MPRSSDGETVVLAEQIAERASRKPVFSKIPAFRTDATKTLVNNFTCPMCHQTLERAVAINGEVRGWCGVAKANVRIVASNN